MVPSTYQSLMTAFHSAAAIWVETSEACGLTLVGTLGLSSEHPVKARPTTTTPSDARTPTPRTYNALIRIS